MKSDLITNYTPCRVKINKMEKENLREERETVHHRSNFDSISIVFSNLNENFKIFRENRIF